MKALVLAVTVLFSTQTFAQVSDYEQIACDTLMESAQDTCQQVLLEQCMEDFTQQECEDGQDGDWAVAHQECTWGEMTEVLIPEHNKNNPERPAITCEDT